MVECMVKQCSCTVPSDEIVVLLAPAMMQPPQQQCEFRWHDVCRKCVIAHKYKYLKEMVQCSFTPG